MRGAMQASLVIDRKWKPPAWTEQPSGAVTTYLEDEDGQRFVVNAKRCYVIGSDINSCDIIKHELAPQHAVLMHHRNGSVLLQSLNEFAHIAIDDEPVNFGSKPTTLSEGSRLNLGALSTLVLRDVRPSTRQLLAQGPPPDSDDEEETNGTSGHASPQAALVKANTELNRRRRVTVKPGATGGRVSLKRMNSEDATASTRGSQASSLDDIDLNRRPSGVKRTHPDASNAGPARKRRSSLKVRFADDVEMDDSE